MNLERNPSTALWVSHLLYSNSLRTEGKSYFFQIRFEERLELVKKDMVTYSTLNLNEIIAGIAHT